MRAPPLPFRLAGGVDDAHFCARTRLPMSAPWRQAALSHEIMNGRIGSETSQVDGVLTLDRRKRRHAAPSRTFSCKRGKNLPPIPHTRREEGVFRRAMPERVWVRAIPIPPASPNQARSERPHGWRGRSRALGRASGGAKKRRSPGAGRASGTSRPRARP